MLKLKLHLKNTVSLDQTVVNKKRNLIIRFDDNNLLFQSQIQLHS